MVGKKKRDWRAQLAATIEKSRRIPYSDINNCGMFLFDCIAAMTGTDLGAPFRGKFTTLAEAFVLLRRLGFGDLPSYLAANLTEISHPVMAASGDVMLIEVDGGWAGGIVTGERIIVLSTHGQGTVSRVQGKRAFRIP